MKVLVAGATGAIGRPLIAELRRAGHDVLALHRTTDAAGPLRASDATPVRADVLDRRGLLAALAGLQADAVIAELTALKKTPIRHRDMAMTDRLRTEGTANLVAAARALGARRLVTQSIVFGYGFGDWGGRVLTEADPFGPPGRGRFEDHVAALRSNEHQVLTADGLIGTALRYGLFYGPGPASANMVDGVRRRRLPVVRRGGPLPWVSIGDAATATAAALHAPGGAYNVVDDLPVSLSDMITATAQIVGAPKPRVLPEFALALTPYARSVMKGGLMVSNAKAQAELGWVLRAPTYREGLAELAGSF
ncbi:MAG TPA: NAD(P)-dependent oxidoreductase [Acidimicrobiales bacterium]|jgi:nucleoside-diphosphate-sugar epimerase|nr:NAD(P)-dependent oxidoreductase [Acidimicrobiales bacterium]